MPVQPTLTQLEALYREHGQALLRYLRRRFGGVDSAEDLLQETFVQALHAGGRLEAAASPRAWLFGVARHVGLTWVRRRRDTSPLPDQLADRPARGEDARLAAMRRAMAGLPEPQREALELRLRDELSYEEIAEALRIPVGTVRSRLHHAVKRLTAVLASHDSAAVDE